jgi:glycerol-3-phosphate dehydrogenase
MWTTGWRDRTWAQLAGPWDLIVIGGGITGAGILREAVRAGLRALLVDAADFGAGTSSRSSKLVHGGLRYLQQAEIRLTLESVRERDRLLREGRGLVTRLGFLLPNYAGDRPPQWVLGLGLTVYDILALRWSHRHYDALDIHELCPELRTAGLQGGYRFSDAQTDDARLVLRVIREAVAMGGVALSYARVERLLRRRSGEVCGVALRDLAPEGQGRTVEIEAPVVISATGAWADDLRAGLGAPPRLRRLRGSHLIFPGDRLPLRRAISFMHPRDHRPVSLVPWEGVLLFGTTDADYSGPLEVDPGITPSELEYLLEGLAYAFPGRELGLADVQATQAGVRPVVNTGQANPSRESREFVLWREAGLLTVTGGKLTTFRLMAHQALRAVRARLPGRPRFSARERLLDPPPADVQWPVALSELDSGARLRLLGRYAADAPALIAAAGPGELAPIGRSPLLWAQLRWAARAEGVVHLDDLLLRRVRLGLLLPRGGLDEIERVRAIAQPELGWDDARWTVELDAYTRLWRARYTLPDLPPAERPGARSHTAAEPPPESLPQIAA